MIESTALRDNREFYTAWAAEAEKEMQRPARPSGIDATNNDNNKPSAPLTQQQQQQQQQQEQRDGAVSDDEAAAAQHSANESSLAEGLGDLKLFRQSDSANLGHTSGNDSTRAIVDMLPASLRPHVVRVGVSNLLQLLLLLLLVLLVFRLRSQTSQALIIAQQATTAASRSAAQLSLLHTSVVRLLQHSTIQLSNKNNTKHAYTQLNIDELKSLIDSVLLFYFFLLFRKKKIITFFCLLL